MQFEKDEKTGHVTWKQLEIQKIKNKDNQPGVVALVDLPIGTKIPYFGLEINEKCSRELCQQQIDDPKGRWYSYVLDCGNILIDAHPRYQPDQNGIGGNGLYIGGKINEPAKGECINCELISRKGLGFIKIVCSIKAGQELLVYYGDEYVRNYSIGHFRTPNSRYSLRYTNM